MEIKHNNHTAKVLEINGEKCLRVFDLGQISSHDFSSIYQIMRNKKAKFAPYIRKISQKRNTCLTLDGCISVLNSFRTPEKDLIAVIKSLKKPNTTDLFFHIEHQPKAVNQQYIKITKEQTITPPKPDPFRSLLKECIKEIIREKL